MNVVFYTIERGIKLFQTGELVVYGINGVCRVEDVVEMSAPGGKEKHKYYTLMPI